VSFRDALNTAGTDGESARNEQDGLPIDGTNPDANGAEKSKARVAKHVDVEPEGRTVSQALSANRKKAYSWGLSATVFVTIG
jgi:hypothetical protein